MFTSIRYHYLAAVVLLALTCEAAPSTVDPDILPVDHIMCEKMKAAEVIHESAPVGCDRLRVVRFSYTDFDGQTHRDGQIMVLDAVATNVQAIFRELHMRKFPITEAKLMDEYRGDDETSMAKNNTSAFNDRPITGGGSPSQHAYGLAIDINPIQNPYIQFTLAKGTATFSPTEGVKYANRLKVRPSKDIRSGMAEDVVEMFAENGFLIWGGEWDSPIDYQHFQVSGAAFAKRLSKSSPEEARALFLSYVDRYRSCKKRHQSQDSAAARATCVVYAQG
jgi:hypothetical protein